MDNSSFIETILTTILLHALVYFNSVFLGSERNKMLHDMVSIANYVLLAIERASSYLHHRKEECFVRFLVKPMTTVGISTRFFTVSKSDGMRVYGHYNTHALFHVATDSYISELRRMVFENPQIKFTRQFVSIRIMSIRVEMASKQQSLAFLII